jgi:hypothetical protein
MVVEMLRGMGQEGVAQKIEAVRKKSKRITEARQRVKPETIFMKAAQKRRLPAYLTN